MPGATFKEGCTPRVALVQAVLDKESLLQFCALGASLPHTCLALLLEVRVSTDHSGLWSPNQLDTDIRNQKSRSFNSSQAMSINSTL